MFGFRLRLIGLRLRLRLIGLRLRLRLIGFGFVIGSVFDFVFGFGSGFGFGFGLFGRRRVRGLPRVRLIVFRDKVLGQI